MRELKEIIVHCSATKPDMDIGADEIKKWHTDPKPEGNGWSDIGYHYVIRRNGNLEMGRELALAGAHAKGRNANSIGVCLVGGLDKNGKSDANFTLPQYATLNSLIGELKQTYGEMPVIGHRDVPDSGKDCPCFDVGAMFC